MSHYSKAFGANKDLVGNVRGLYHLEETKLRNDSRFLLEMEIDLLKPEKRVVHTSEYIYLKKGQLCQIPGFQWTRNVEVHLIVAGNSWLCTCIELSQCDHFYIL